MPRVRVKVCGLTRREDVRAVGALGVDAVGFNFCPESPRAVTPEAARALIRLLPSFVARVGVFRDRAGAEVDEIAAAVGLDRLQLHGDESPEYCAARRRPVLKVLRIGPGWSRLLAESYREWPVLVDAWHAQWAGGTGLRADWPAARELVEAGWDVTLAGGLGPDTLAEAVRQVRPAAVDLNSAVETAPGVKDMTRIARALAILQSGILEDAGPEETA